jgi:hypothetical protein
MSSTRLGSRARNAACLHHVRATCRLSALSRSQTSAAVVAARPGGGAAVAAKPTMDDGQSWLVLERARIGRSGVGLGRVVSDLLEREAGEFRGEFT